MELRVLKYFLTVAAEGSITRASNVLHVTQPTLSRQLMDLEDELGHKLFIRSSHSIKLTQEGILLRKRAEEILAMVERTESEFQNIKGNISGDIYIGGGETYAMKKIAQIACELQKEYPDIRYHLYSGNSDDVTEKLEKGLLDFGILIQPADISKYDYLNLPDKDIWGVIMRKDSSLAKRDKIKRKDLLEVPLLCSRQAISKITSKNEFSEWFGDGFENLNIVATYNLIYNASVMVAEGMGCAIALDKLVDTSSKSKFCFKALSPKLESDLNVVWKKERLFSPATEIFLKRMKKEFAK